jgi:DNA-binding transcriptional ArsR family regulator
MLRPFSALQELGDTTRLSVFLAILGIRKNVSQIVAELGLAQPQVSYHLRKLKDAGLAVEEKDGRWVWYQANWDAADRNLRDFIELVSRWAVDAGAAEGGRPATAGGGTGAEPVPVGARPVKRPRPDKPGDRPDVERPKKRDSDMDDFLL